MGWNEPYRDQELYRVLDQPRTIFPLNMKYHPGLRELEVFYNGIPAVLGEDYLETDMHTITFLFPVEVGDIIFFQKRNW